MSVSISCSEIDVAKENAESPRTGMRIPDRFISEDGKQSSKSMLKISVSGGHKKADVCDLLQKHTLLYVLTSKIAFLCQFLWSKTNVSVGRY